MISIKTTILHQNGVFDRQQLLNFKTKLVCGLGLHIAQRHLLFFSNLWPFPDVHDSPLCLKKQSSLLLLLHHQHYPTGSCCPLLYFMPFTRRRAAIFRKTSHYCCITANAWLAEGNASEALQCLNQIVFCSRFQFKVRFSVVAGGYILRLVVELAHFSVCHVCTCLLCFQSASQNVTYYILISFVSVSSRLLETDDTADPKGKMNSTLSTTSNLLLLHSPFLFQHRYFFPFIAGNRSHTCIIDVGLMLCHWGV